MKTRISLSEETEQEEKPTLPEVHYGSAEDKPLDWRESEPDDSPDDDSELDETPPDVLSLIGFDPLDSE